MKNSNKNQRPNTPFANFLRKFGVWLYTHADTLAEHAKLMMGVACLFVNLAMLYLILLIGGAM